MSLRGIVLNVQASRISTALNPELLFYVSKIFLY